VPVGERTRHVRTLVQPAAETGSDTLAGCGLMTFELQALDNPVDALGQGADVIGIDRGEHRDP